MESINEIDEIEDDFEYPQLKRKFTTSDIENKEDDFDNQKSEVQNQIVIKLYKIENQYFNTAQEGADALNMTYPTFTRKYKKQDVKVRVVD